jgi:S1-C subfamily serine protease
MTKYFVCLLLFLFSTWSQAGSTGTGFLVSADGLVATSNHVIEDGHSIQFSFKGQRYDARKVAQDEANDLAILKVEGEFPFLEIRGSEDASIGEEIFTVGFPNPAVQGFEPKMTTGVISSLSGIQDDPTCYQISVPVQPGNSGGPLLTQQGDVIGIIKAKLNPRVGLATANALPENVNYAVKSDYLNILIKLAKAKVKKTDAKNQAKNPAEPLQGVDKALACVGLVEVSAPFQPAGGVSASPAVPRTFAPESPIWSECLAKIDDDIKLAESINMIDPDDPWDKYIEIRPKLHERVQKFMDKWKDDAEGFNTWLQSGLIGLAIREGQFEDEFKRFKKEVGTFNLPFAKVLRKHLAYHKTSRAKILSSGRYLLPEKFQTEFKDRVLDPNVAEIHDDVLRESIDSARSLGKDSAIAKSEVVASDKVGAFFTDPTINDSVGVNVVTYEYFHELKKQQLVSEDSSHASVLIVSYISGDPYTLTLSKTPRAEIIAVPTESKNKD